MPVPKELANIRSKDAYKVSDSHEADNSLHAGIKIETTVDLINGRPAALFGLYAVARGNNNAGPDGVHDVVGVHGTVLKNGIMWTAGMHCDVYDMVPGGTAIGLNMEF